MIFKFLLTNKKDFAIKYSQRSHSLVYSLFEPSIGTVKKVIPIQSLKSNNYVIKDIIVVVSNSAKEVKEAKALRKKRLNCPKEIIHICNFEPKEDLKDFHTIRADGFFAYNIHYKDHNGVANISLEEIAFHAHKQKAVKKTTKSKGKSNVNKPVQKSNNTNKANK